jgi:hypothetical protein
MTVYASKPEINVREKLKELDYGHVPYEKMPAGSVLQMQHDTLTDNGVNTTVNNTTIFGILDITFYRKSASSKFIIAIDTIQYRPSTSGENRMGYRYLVNDGPGVDWVFENRQWKYTGDAISWYRVAATFQEDFFGHEGDEIRIQTAFINTAATTSYIRTPSLTVWEIK